MQVIYQPFLPDSGYTSNLYFAEDKHGKFIASVITPQHRIYCDPRYQHDLPRMQKIVRAMNWTAATVVSQNGQVEIQL